MLKTLACERPRPGRWVSRRYEFGRAPAARLCRRLRLRRSRQGRAVSPLPRCRRGCRGCRILTPRPFSHFEADTLGSIPDTLGSIPDTLMTPCNTPRPICLLGITYLKVRVSAILLDFAVQTQTTQKYRRFRPNVCVFVLFPMDALEGPKSWHPDTLALAHHRQAPHFAVPWYYDPLFYMSPQTGLPDDFFTRLPATRGAPRNAYRDRDHLQHRL